MTIMTVTLTLQGQERAIHSCVLSPYWYLKLLDGKDGADNELSTILTS